VILLRFSLALTFNRICSFSSMQHKSASSFVPNNKYIEEMIKYKKYKVWKVVNLLLTIRTEKDGNEKYRKKNEIKTWHKRNTLQKGENQYLIFLLWHKSFEQTTAQERRFLYFLVFFAVSKSLINNLTLLRIRAVISRNKKICLFWWSVSVAPSNHHPHHDQEHLCEQNRSAVCSRFAMKIYFSLPCTIFWKFHYQFNSETLWQSICKSAKL
jgi:hypothetical protein